MPETTTREGIYNFANLGTWLNFSTRYNCHPTHKRASKNFHQYRYYGQNVEQIMSVSNFTWDAFWGTI